MEGISGLSLISAPQRSFLDKIMKNQDAATDISMSMANMQNSQGMPPLMRSGLGIPNLGNLNSFGSPYIYVPSANGVMSPKSPPNQIFDNTDRKGGSFSLCLWYE